VRSSSTLTVGNASALGSTNVGTFVNTGATLDLNGFNVGTEVITLQTTTSKLASSNTNTAATVGGNITISTSTSEIGGPGSLTLSGVVSSTTTGGFSKTGTGTLTLSASNTYSGTTTLSNGTIRIGNKGALGTGGFTINGGTFASDSGTARTITNAITMGGNVQFGDATGTGALTLSNIDLGRLTRTFTVSNNTTVAGAITNTGGLTKAGAGTLVLAAANSYTGPTVVGNGTLIASNSSALGTGEVKVTNGATVVAATGTTVANNFTIGTPTAFATNAYASTNVAQWDFSTLAGGSGNYGPSPFAPTNTVGGLEVEGLTRGAGVTQSGSAAANAWGGTGFDTNSSAAAITAGDFATFSVVILDGYALNITNFGAYNVRRSSTAPTDGLWQWSTNGTTFTDIGTSITWGAVTTAAGNPQSAIALDGISALQSLGAGTTVTFRVANWNGAATGTWYLNDPTDTTATDFSVGGQLATVTGSAYTGTGTLGIGEAGEATFSGNVVVGNTATLSAVASSKATFSGVISGPGTDITKSGAGTVTLSGTSANTFAGKTTVSQGTLQLDKTAGTTAVAGNLSVSNGATLLISTSDQVSNSSAVTLSGGTISRASGVSEVFGNLNITAASFLNFGSGTTGNLQFQSYTNTGSALVTVQSFFQGNSLQFASATFNAGNLAQFSFDNGYTTSIQGDYFTITAIPEPSTVLAALGLAGLMLWPVARRKFLG
jgi:autotransporter-associated beta strand protein